MNLAIRISVRKTRLHREAGLVYARNYDMGASCTSPRVAFITGFILLRAAVFPSQEINQLKPELAR